MPPINLHNSVSVAVSELHGLILREKQMRRNNRLDLTCDLLQRTFLSLTNIDLALQEKLIRRKKE